MCLAILANSSYIYSNENIVKTDSGITHGYVKNGIINWDDIPYALPPTNDLRWKAPRKIESSSKIIKQKENNFCVQQPSGMGGAEGKGFRYQMEQFQEERIFGAAGALKMLEQVIKDTIEYTSQRKAFGKSILDNQVVHFRLAELQTEVELLRALVYTATEEYINGEDVTMKASMMKLKAGRLGREVTDSCLQYWGGMGYMWDTPVSRAFRDGRLTSIGGGADEIMLGIISKHMGTSPSR